MSLMVVLLSSEAFNATDNGIPMGHLSEMELRGTALELIQSFLEGYVQKAVLEDYCSMP